MRTLFYALVALTPLIASCGPIARGGGSRSSGGGGGSSGGDSAAFTSRCRGDFGQSAEAAEFEAFMTATYELHQAAEAADNELRSTCVQMATALEIQPAASGTGPEATRAVCDQVANTLRSEMQAIRAGTDVQVELHTRPPRCEARFDAYAECAASCDVSVDPGQLEMNCTGGEIRGGCSGSCSGRCAVEVEAQCSGTCEGWCEGTCAARAADGSCAGQCDGTCHGECVTDVSAECSGECRGSCSVEWERPYCTGTYEPPQVNADCRAACEARVDASLECRPGSAELAVTGGPDEAAQARIARVRAAIEVGLANVQAIHARTERLVASGREVVSRMRSLPDAIREVGLHAAACSAGALADMQQSVASISVTVEVSVSVSASASATAG